MCVCANDICKGMIFVTSLRNEKGSFILGNSLWTFRSMYNDLLTFRGMMHIWKYLSIPQPLNSLLSVVDIPSLPPHFYHIEYIYSIPHANIPPPYINCKCKLSSETNKINVNQSHIFIPSENDEIRNILISTSHSICFLSFIAALFGVLLTVWYSHAHTSPNICVNKLNIS